MPQQEQSHRTQDAVYWPLGTPDDYGEPTRGEAVPLKVRWVYTKRQTRDANNNVVMTDAVAVVDRVIAPQSFMWLGHLDDFSEAVDNEIMEVVSQDVYPDVKGRATDYRCNLARFKGSLPAEEA